MTYRLVAVDGAERRTVATGLVSEEEADLVRRFMGISNLETEEEEE